MPLFHTASAAAPIFQDLEPGLIIAVGAFSAHHGEDFNATWVEVGVTESLNSLESRTFIFFAGFISYHQPLSWTGQYLIKPSQQLYLDITGDLAPAIKVFEQRIIPSKILPGGAVHA